MLKLLIWLHISAARYEIAIVIILGISHDNSKFPGKFIDKLSYLESFIGEVRPLQQW